MRIAAALLTLTAASGIFSGCVTGWDGPPPSAVRSSQRLADLMTGSFSSAAQAAADKDFLEIVLHMSPIWTDRADGPWLYVEQAVASAPGRPYRQRVYRLVDLEAGAVRSDVYTLPGDALRFAGAWTDGAKLAGLSPDQLTLRAGCSLTLRPVNAGASFVGTTEGTGCASDLRGAAYATSEATVTADRLISWDRGFDSAGRQVWGAVKGGYVFDKAPPADRGVMR